MILGLEMSIVWLFLNYKLPISLINFADVDTSVTTTQLDAEIENNSNNNSFVLKINGSDSVSFPLFTIGTHQKKILELLGEPVWRKPGYWDNSIVWFYKNMLSMDIDIGFIFDTQTQKLRQAEISLPPSIKLEDLYGVLDSYLYFTPVHIEKKLEAVYWRQTNHQEFEIDNLKAVIQRNDQDHIYISVWESDFH